MNKSDFSFLKQVYYHHDILTDEEKTRYLKFSPLLTNEELDEIKNWYKVNIKNFAIINNEYVFFTLTTECDLFKHWFKNFKRKF